MKPWHIAAIVGAIIASQAGTVLLIRTTLPLPPPVDSAPDAPITRAAAELEALRSKLATDKAKAARLERLYAEFARVLHGDASNVTNLAQFRAAHVKLLELYRANEGVPVGAEIDRVLEVELGGLEPRPLTPELRASLVRALEGISQAAKRAQ